MILLKVDVSKIERARLFVGKNGAKYLDLVLFENRDGTDKYGNDGFCAQGQTKEERQAGKTRPIIGNYKVFRSPGNGSSTSAAATASPPIPESPTSPIDDNSEIPF